MRSPWPPPAWLRSSWTADVFLAIAVLVIEIGGVVLGAPQPDGTERPLDVFGYTLIVISASSLVLRRRRPMLVLALTAVPMAVYYPAGYPEGGPVYLAALIALYSAAAAGHRFLAILTFVTACVFNFTGGFLPAPGRYIDIGDLVFSVAAGSAVLVGGEVARSRRAYLQQVEKRAAEAERRREEEARRRADEERLRIARELHDVLAHNISMMNVQAGVAAHLLHQQPEQAHDALLTIKQSSKDALRELRATLGTLRRVDAGDDTSARAPTPGLARLGDLVTRAEAAGLTVDLQTAGTTREVPDGVDLAAYRIIQEALTNVTRHAEASTATVTLDYQATQLDIRIDDNGRGVPLGGFSEGNGLLGMRERVEGHGGELAADPGEGGGFRIRARLPIVTAASSDGHGRGPYAGDSSSNGDESKDTAG